MRPARARIDLSALRHNYGVARQAHGSQVMAVLKANGYGHGAIPCAQALQQTADGFAVAFVAEGVALREAGIQGPLLSLEGCFDMDELQQCVVLDIWPVVHQLAQVEQIERLDLPAGRQLHVWLKIDTGMHRVGFAPEAIAAIYRRLLASGKVGQITFMTHFAQADDLAVEATRRQIERFNQATVGLEGGRSLSNSAAIQAWPAAYGDWGRQGISLYGVDPVEQTRPHPDLRAVMTLEAGIFAERWLEPGDALSYGATFVAERRTRIGLVALGYADGYPRSAPTGTAVWVRGQRTRLVGRVCMDMLMVDLTDLPEAGSGDWAEFWGPHIPVGEIAAAVGTISYELLCNVKRVAFEYQS